MIDPSTNTLYINKPHDVEAHRPDHSMHQFSHHHHLSCMPDNTIPVELNFPPNPNTILPFCTLTRLPPSPTPSTFFSYIHSLPQWEQFLPERVHLPTDAFTVTSHLSQPDNKWITVSDGSVQHSQTSFRWVIARTSRQRIAQCNGLVHRHKPTQKVMASSLSCAFFLIFPPTHTK